MTPEEREWKLKQIRSYLATERTFPARGWWLFLLFELERVETERDGWQNFGKDVLGRRADNMTPEEARALVPELAKCTTCQEWQRMYDALMAKCLALGTALKAVKEDVLREGKVMGRTQRLAEEALAPDAGKELPDRIKALEDTLEMIWETARSEESDINTLDVISAWAREALKPAAKEGT